MQQPAAEFRDRTRVSDIDIYVQHFVVDDDRSHWAKALKMRDQKIKKRKTQELDNEGPVRNESSC